MTTKATPYPFVLKKDFLTVTVGKKPFSFNSSHPTFKDLRKALKAHEWAKIPKLLTIADKVNNQSKGQIVVRDGTVYYHGKEVKSALSRRMVQMIQEDKPIKHMVKFMENLYANPFGTNVIDDLYQFLEKCQLPITDDGCFMGYKKVDDSYKDCYSHTIDNHVGRIVKMPGSIVDKSTTACSIGLHVGNLNYFGGSYGGFHRGEGHTMMVKVNPKDVIAVPYSESKLRCTQYEVVGEVTKQSEVDTGTADAKDFLTSVYPVAKDKQVLLSKILAHPVTKSHIRKGKIKKMTLVKYPIGKLQSFAKKLPALTSGPKGIGHEYVTNILKSARQEQGVTTAQIAKKLGKKPAEITKWEKDPKIGSAQVDSYLIALESLKGMSPSSSAISVKVN